MLGKRYLETRKNLAEVLDAVKSLAFQLHVEYSELEHEDIEVCLTSPLRIAVSGDSESGKTSFLNTLIGEVGDNESDSTINVYGSAPYWHGGYHQYVKYTQIESLGEVEIVDSRGVSKLSKDEREALKELMTEADHVFWIMSSENPWAAKSWDFVTEMKDYVGNRCSVVLQKTDLLKKRDVKVLVEHLTSLSVQRVGHALPIRCVSALAAEKAWNSGECDERIWSDSGFKEIESALDHYLNSGEERRGALQYVARYVKLVLERIEATMREEVRVLRSDTHSLKLVEAEVEQARENEVDNLQIGLQQVASIISEQVHSSLQYVLKKTSLRASIISVFTRADGALEVEKKLQQDVSEAGYVRAREVALNLLAKCELEWKTMRDDLQRRMAVDVVGFNTKIFEINVEKFSMNMQNHIKRAMMMLKLSRLLDRMMIMRQRRLKRMMSWILVLVSIAGGIGYYDLSFFIDLPWLILSIAGGLFGYMLQVSHKSKKALLTAYSDRLHNASFEFAEMMEEPYSAEMREFYTGYTSMFENLRRYIVKSEESLVPKQEKWHALFLRYKAVEQDI